MKVERIRQLQKEKQQERQQKFAPDKEQRSFK
jgi:hypothetical protein